LIATHFHEGSGPTDVIADGNLRLHDKDERTGRKLGYPPALQKRSVSTATPCSSERM